MFNSSINDLLRYQQSRIPLVIYLPLAIFLVVASGTPLRSDMIFNGLINALLALSLTVQFRLWDDLADVDRDRVRTPNRTLCQATSLNNFWILLVLLFILNGCLLAACKSQWAVLAFLTLNVYYAVWYSVGSRIVENCWFASAVVLAKYPVFVYLLSDQPHGELRTNLHYGMALSFLSFYAYEVLHDPSLRTAAYASYLLAGTLIAASAVAACMLIEVRHSTWLTLALHAGLTALGCVIFLWLFQQQRRHKQPGLWCFSVFWVSFAWLLTYHAPT